MPDLGISTDYVRMLALKIGALSGNEPAHYPDPASNPTDDPLSVLKETPDDRSREEVIRRSPG